MEDYYESRNFNKWWRLSGFESVSYTHLAQIDGITTNFSGDYPTLIVHNLDQPGHVAEVTSMLSHKCVNIAAMQLYLSLIHI